MHPVIIYFFNSNKELVKEIKTQLAFTPELQTTIYHDKVKAVVNNIIIDVTPKMPAIVIHATIK